MSLDRQRIDGVKTLLREGWKWSLPDGWVNPKAPPPSVPTKATAAAPSSIPSLLRSQQAPPTSVFKEYQTSAPCEYVNSRGLMDKAISHWTLDHHKVCVRCGTRVLP